MNKNLLILGAGQYGRVVKEIATDMNCFEKISFLDDNSSLAVGKLTDYKFFEDSYSYAFVAIGNPDIRIKWLDLLEETNYTIPVLIHPKAYVSPSAKIMDGSIVEPMVVVHTECTIEKGCFISAGAVINHAAKCLECCHIDCNATVSGYAVVPAGTKVNIGAVFDSKSI